MAIGTYTNYLDDYLIENIRRNHIADHYRMNKIRKAATTFDALTTQEPDNSDVTLDLLAEESSSFIKSSKSRTKSSVGTVAISPTKQDQTSETSKAEERETVTQTRTGIRLTCPKGHVWVYTGRLDRRWTNCGRCKASTKLPEQESNKQ